MPPANSININVLVDAKKEYLRHLTKRLAPLMFDRFMSFRYDLENPPQQGPENIKGLSGDELTEAFLFLLNEIPNWNQVRIDAESKEIIDKFKFIEDVLLPLLIAHVKILASVRMGGDKKKVPLTLPKVQNFLHTCFKDIGNEFYYHPEYFDRNSSSYPENREKAMRIIKDGISDAVLNHVNVEKIISEYVKDALNTPEAKTTNVPPAVAAEDFDTSDEETPENGDPTPENGDPTPESPDPDDNEAPKDVIDLDDKPANTLPNTEPQLENPYDDPPDNDPNDSQSPPEHDDPEDSQSPPDNPEHNAPHDEIYPDKPQPHHDEPYSNSERKPQFNFHSESDSSQSD